MIVAWSVRGGRAWWADGCRSRVALAAEAQVVRQTREDAVTHAIGIVVWALALLWAVGHGIMLRQKARREQAAERAYETHALLLAVSVTLIPALSLSPFHLLWMVPASFVLGLASMMFPLNLLWLPASLYGRLWYVGLRTPVAGPNRGPRAANVQEDKEPWERLESMCPDVNEFLTNLTAELDARGVGEDERLSAETDGLNEFASKHLLECALCRGELSTDTYLRESGMVFEEGERVRINTSGGVFRADQAYAPADLQADVGKTGMVLGPYRGLIDEEGPARVVRVRWDEQPWIDAQTQGGDCGS